MFQPWRLKLREAEVALKAGRLEEAYRLISQGDLREFLPAKKLLAELARRFAERGQAHAARGESLAGWNDFAFAGKLGADDEKLAALRKQLIDQGLAEADEYLQAGNVEACLARLDALERRQATREIRQLKQLARRVEEARRRGRRGEFAQAEESLNAAAALRPDLKILGEGLQTCREKQAAFRTLDEQLHAALSSQDWTRVLATADQLLELAPEYTVALDARRRAWSAVGMAAVGRSPGPGVQAVARAPRGLRRAEALPRLVTSMSDPQPALEDALHTPGRRFLLWIDGVGGYLVCEADEVLVGQPGQVDVPILGDLSRQHVKISRNGEGYLLAPFRRTAVNGRPVAGMTSLTDGSLIELGEGVKLRFRRPHPLSATARLEFVSHHRTQPSADGVLLLAESCILGPADSHHVTCHGWSRQVVLFRQEGELCCRTSGAFQIDGITCPGTGRLAPGSRVSGDDFSLSLEAI
jgi:hypothetical protein